MQSYITEKIQLLQSELLRALDRNDYLAALKIRAAQKELEELLDEIEKQENAMHDAIRDAKNYYTSREAARILGLDPSNVTRKATVFHARKIGGKWYFPKDVIDEESNKTGRRAKPGRKPKNVHQSPVKGGDYR